MGCCYSRIEREEMVSRCKARKRYMKELVRARQALSAAHAMYLRSLRSTGTVLLQFSNSETALHHNQVHLHHHLQPPQPRPQTPIQQPRPPPPPPPPSMSPSSDTWTTTTSISASPLPPPPPPPPPPPAAPSWDFWDPFVVPASRSLIEEEWDEGTTVVSEVATVTAVGASVTAPPSVVSGFSKDTSNSELAMVVSRNSKDLVEIIKELDEYFLKSADGGSHVSYLLEVTGSSFSSQLTSGKVHNYGKSLSPLMSTCSSYSKLNSFGKCSEDVIGHDVSSETNSSHSCTIERLYAWEKKLFMEVKNAEIAKKEHEKKITQLRKLEMKNADYMKTEKLKKEVESLESKLMVSSQAIDSTSAEIIKLRETELYPQLIELVKGLMCMWRSMYESHQVQTHIVQQLKYLNTIPSLEPTSEIHRQSTLQLELEIQQWHLSFLNLIKAQRDYIQSLTGWLRLSLFQFNRKPITQTTQESKIYSLCEEWHLALDRVPDKVASDGIKSLLTVLHAIVVQQAEEQKQKKKSESAFRDLEKRSSELRSLESKHGKYSMPDTSSSRIQVKVAEKRAKVEILRAKAEEEKAKHEKSVGVTRAMTLNNLQMGFPHVFQAMTGFSSVCVNVFESVYNQAKMNQEMQNLKMLLP